MQVMTSFFYIISNSVLNNNPIIRSYVILVIEGIVK
jgi:hypothetical protein